MNEQTSSSKNTKRTLIILFAIAIVGIIAGVISTQFKPSKTPDYLSGYGGNFTLQSAQGPVSLTDFKGKVVAMYFGYTSCPDACPTTMAMLTAALNKLEKQEREKVQILLVTFDPERDTPEVLETYVKQFNSQSIGLTGSKQQINKVTKQYGALYEKVELPNSAIDYAFDHSSVTVIIDVENNLRSLVRDRDSIDEIVAKMRESMEG